MKLNAAFRYQLFDHKTSVMVYYIVIIAMSLLAGISLSAFAGWRGVPNADSSVGSLSYSGATAVFLFISGLCGFKENFLFALQSGVSRKTLFLSRLIAFGVLAVFMTVADYVLSYVFALIVTWSTGLNLTTAAVLSAPGLFMALLYAFAMLALGYCITILFFRLNKTGKIIVGAGVPVFFIFILPMFDGFVLGGVIMRPLIRLIEQVMEHISSQTSEGFLIVVLATAAFAVLSWIMMRRAAIKK